MNLGTACILGILPSLTNIIAGVINSWKYFVDEPYHVWKKRMWWFYFVFWICWMQPFTKTKIQLETIEELRQTYLLLLQYFTKTGAHLISVWLMHNSLNIFPLRSVAVRRVFSKTPFLEDPLGKSCSLFLFISWWIVWWRFSFHSSMFCLDLYLW